MSLQPTLFSSHESDIGRPRFQETIVPDVAVAVLHNRTTDKVLLIRRSVRAGFSGWAFPGGKIERPRDANPIDAARRELEEETGVVMKGGREIFCRKHPATGVLIRYVYFQVRRHRLNQNASNQEPEKADECAWVELEKVDRMFRGGLSRGLLRGIKRATISPVKKRDRLACEPPLLLGDA